MTGTVVYVARCPVCRTMHAARTRTAGCATCVARRGARFVALVHRFRHDPEFQRAVLARASPAIVDALCGYFVDRARGVPPMVRGPFDD